MSVKETYLTVKQLAEIKGCTERYIQSCVNKGKIIAEVTIGKVSGNAGTHYSIALSKPDEKVQLKYKRYLKKQQKEVEKQVQEQETEEQQNNSRFDRKRETKCDVLA